MDEAQRAPLGQLGVGVGHGTVADGRKIGGGENPPDPWNHPVAMPRGGRRRHDRDAGGGAFEDAARNRVVPETLQTVALMGTDDDEVGGLLGGHVGESYVRTPPVRLDPHLEVIGAEQFVGPGLEVARQHPLDFRRVALQLHRRGPADPRALLRRPVDVGEHEFAGSGAEQVRAHPTQRGVGGLREVEGDEDPQGPFAAEPRMERLGLPDDQGGDLGVLGGPLRNASEEPAGRSAFAE